MSNEPKPARKYKIAYVIDGLSMGGAERLMVPILKYLNRANFEAHVCALQSKDGNPMAEEIRALGVPVDCLEIRHLRDLNALPRLNQLARFKTAWWTSAKDHLLIELVKEGHGQPS